MTAPLFVDVSSFQGTIDFHAYCAWAKQWDGISRIAIKSTEGVGLPDPQFAANRAGALAAGIDQIFYYHFARPDLGNLATTEASWCHSVVGAIRKNDLVVLDIEVQALATESWAHVWLASMEGYYGTLPGIYASSSYVESRLQDARLAKYPLWLAVWQFTPDERPPVPAPWTSYEAVQYTDRAANIPGIAGAVDASIFLGGPPMNNVTYGPNSADFDTWFTANDGDHWTCKQTGAVIQYGNLGLFSGLSTDGNTLPVIGLPRTPELYQQESDGYAWSVQFFERGVIIYDPSYRQDSQPGFGTSYLGKYSQFMHLDPAYQPPTPTTVVKVPDDLDTVARQLATSVDTMTTLAKQYGWLK